MRRVRFRLTTGLLMKLVAYVAVALGCVMPVVEFAHAYPSPAMSGSSGVLLILGLEGIAIPLAWAGLTMLVIRPESGRDRLVFALLLVPVTTGLIFWVFFFFGVIVRSHRNPAAFGGERSTMIALGFFVVVFALQVAMAVILARRALRGPMPVESRRDGMVERNGPARVEGGRRP